MGKHMYNLEFSLEDEDLLKSKQTNVRGFTDGNKFYSESYLWKASKDLPEEDVELASLLDTKIKWTTKTIFDFCIHMRKVEEADIKHPIIFSASGKLMDGYHRVCRAALDKKLTIKCKRFKEDPKPEKLIKNKEE